MDDVRVVHVDSSIFQPEGIKKKILFDRKKSPLKTENNNFSAEYSDELGEKNIFYKFIIRH